jgi:hypothetical protein
MGTGEVCVTVAPSRERELVGRILARETNGRDPAATTISAANGALQQLHDQLARWFGPDGAQAVLSRAADRARVGHSALAELRIRLPERPRLDGPTHAATVPDAAEITDALVALFTAVGSVLTRVIGADMASRLLGQVCSPQIPDLSPGDAPTNEPRTAHRE